MWGTIGGFAATGKTLIMIIIRTKNSRCATEARTMELKKVSGSDLLWFKHENYQSAFKSMAPYEWADILSERLAIRNAVYRENFHDTGHRVPLYDLIVSGEVKTFKSDDSDSLSYGDYVAFWDTEHVVQNVRPVSVADASWLSEELTSCKTLIDDHDVYPIDFLLNQKYLPFATLMIMLDAPDDVILDELKNLLPKYRAAIKSSNDTVVNNITGKFSGVDIDKLKTYKIIEYLDIQIWLGVNRAKITDANLASVLFHDRVDAQTYFSQTVKPFLKKVTEIEFIGQLNIKARSVHNKGK